MNSQAWELLDGLERREYLGDLYWNDPRWKEVNKLRKENNAVAANALVGEIRRTWGVE